VLQIPAGSFGGDSRVWLDLGEVKNLAQVKLNGVDLGVVWKPPFRVDLTSAAEAGANDLEIQVTNLWPNRLIGDEQLPDDVEWRPLGNRDYGRGLAQQDWPEWLLKGERSPSGRFTFTTWKHFEKGDPLLPSGLLGPVQLIFNKTELVR